MIDGKGLFFFYSLGFGRFGMLRAVLRTVLGADGRAAGDSWAAVTDGRRDYGDDDDGGGGGGGGSGSGSGSGQRSAARSN